METLTHLKKCDHSIMAKADLIGQTHWADHFSQRQVVSLAGYMDAYEAKRGETILQQDGTDAYLVLVVSGWVAILKSGTGLEAKAVAAVGPGQSFGEMSLIDGEPRSASAIASTSLSLLLLSKEDFTRLNEESPELGVILVLELARLMSQHLRETTGKLVERL